MFSLKSKITACSPSFLSKKMLQPTTTSITIDPSVISTASVNTNTIPAVASGVSISTTSTSTTTKQKNPLLSPTAESLDAPPTSRIRSTFIVKIQESIKTKWSIFKASFLSRYPHERIVFILFVLGFFIPVLPWFLGYWFYSPRSENKKLKKQSIYSTISQDPEDSYSDYVIYYGDRCREAFNVSSILWTIIVGFIVLAAVVPSVFLAYASSWNMLGNNNSTRIS